MAVRMQSEQKRRQRQLLRAACNTVREQAAVADGGTAAACCANAVLQLGDICQLDLGVLVDEPDLTTLLEAKLRRRVGTHLNQLQKVLERLERCTEKLRLATAPLQDFGSQVHGEKAAPAATMTWRQAGGILLSWAARFHDELQVKQAVFAGMSKLSLDQLCDDRSSLEQTTQVHLTAWKQETRVHQEELQGDLQVLAVELDSLS